jgi:hypothetical protein
MRRVYFLLLLIALAHSVQAHIASTGFLIAHVQGEAISGSLEMSVRDVELGIGIDANRDGKITWGELRASEPRLTRYLQQHLTFSSQGYGCALAFEGLRLNDRVDGVYAWVPFTAHCTEKVGQLGVRYTMLEDIDPSHRGLVTLIAGKTVQTGVLGGEHSQVSFSIDSPARWRAFTEYLNAGIGHIWSGIDHLLFLLSLLLPAVLVRKADSWNPVSHARPAFIGIVKVVTAFTLAHSITLTLAALDMVRLPSRLTESLIAASIIVAAVNNIFPVVTHNRARIAFAFGLLHGFGFASVLADMGLPQGARILSLLAFNLGIEAGQLAVVLAIMPCAYFWRYSSFYRRAIVPWGSAAIALLALVWLVQRSLLTT